MTTRREEIEGLLMETDRPLTVQEICMALHIRERALVYEDLGHIARSVRRTGKRLRVVPPRCGRCGYVFRGRQSMKRPSRCPKCKSEWLLPAAFMVR